MFLFLGIFGFGAGKQGGRQGAMNPEVWVIQNGDEGTADKKADEGGVQAVGDDGWKPVFLFPDQIADLTSRQKAGSDHEEKNEQSGVSQLGSALDENIVYKIRFGDFDCIMGTVVAGPGVQGDA